MCKIPGVLAKPRASAHPFDSGINIGAMGGQIVQRLIWGCYRNKNLP